MPQRQRMERERSSQNGIVQKHIWHKNIDTKKHEIKLTRSKKQLVAYSM